jgi:hypothetical protein
VFDKSLVDAQRSAHRMRSLCSTNQAWLRHDGGSPCGVLPARLTRFVDVEQKDIDVEIDVGIDVDIDGCDVIETSGSSPHSTQETSTSETPSAIAARPTT